MFMGMATDAGLFNRRHNTGFAELASFCRKFIENGQISLPVPGEKELIRQLYGVSVRSG
jgi:hypothetical protein